MKALKYGEINLFADDTAIEIKDKNINSVIKKVNADLNEIDKWLKSNKLMLNVKKTKWMMLSKRNIENACQNIVKIGDESVEQVDHIKYLGVQMDNKLTLGKHIESCISEMNKKVNMLFRISNRMNSDTKRLIMMKLKKNKRYRIEQ